MAKAGRRQAHYQAMASDNSWMQMKACFFCDRLIVVNNWPDRKPRTPKFMGKVVCPWCTPYASDRVTIINKVRYVTCMSRIMVDKLNRVCGCESDCVHKKAQKLYMIHERAITERLLSEVQVQN